MKKALCSRTPKSCRFGPPVKVEEARVSNAVSPPNPTSYLVHVAYMYAKAAVTRFSGDKWPTIASDMVWRLFAGNMQAICNNHWDRIFREQIHVGSNSAGFLELWSTLS